MFTVALIGPDGAGKTTIGRRLEHALPMPVRYLYMGINPDSSNCMLPTTWLIHRIKRACGAKPDTAGPPDPMAVEPAPEHGIRRVVTGLKSGLRLVNRLAEEWFRQGLACYYRRRGCIVLFDRHFFADYYAYDIAGSDRSRTWSRRIHGFLLAHLYPKPDLIIFLDAPAEVLFARKGEGTLAALQQRREEYLQMQSLVEHFAVVDATQPVDDVGRSVAAIIQEFSRVRLAGRMKEQRAHG
jgi:thymidylate kinase